MLGNFADRYLAGFGTGQLYRFEALLERLDGEIYDWAMGRAEPRAAERNDVVDMLLKFWLENSNPSPLRGGRREAEGFEPGGGI